MRIQDKNSKRRPSNIHASVESGDLAAVQTLLGKDHSLLNQKSDIASETPLHVSAAHDKIEITKYLLEWKGQGELEIETENAYGETPLHVAAKNGFSETLRLLLLNGANVEAKTKNLMSPLHLAVGYALRSGDNLAVKTLLEFNADCSATDEEGMSPADYLPIGLQDGELLEILSQNALSTTTDDAAGNGEGNSGAQLSNSGENYDHKPQTRTVEDVMKNGMNEFENELSKLVGQHELKSQLRKWAKGLLFDEKRRAMGLELGPRKRPHMAFLGNPGTGKASTARIVGRLLRSVGVLSTDKVTQVKGSDFSGQIAGGILYVDEAHHLAQEEKGSRALGEIASLLEVGDLVVILAGSGDPMKRVLQSDPGFHGRVTHFFEFDDLSCGELAEMLMWKMAEQEETSRLYGFKLHPACTAEAVLSLIETNTTEKLRSGLNGGLVDQTMSNARENLDSRLTFSSRGDELLTITLEDLEAGIRLLVETVDDPMQ